MNPVVEVLQFVFAGDVGNGFWRFIGCAMLLSIVVGGITGMGEVLARITGVHRK